MLSQIELDYVKALINTYYEKGYKYYVCHTVTETNNDYDICIYFSKEKISAFTDNFFEVNNGLRLYIDSSSKSNYSTSRRDSSSSFSGSVTIDVAEFVYTNAAVEYSLSSIPLNPILTEDYSKNQSISVITVLLCIFLLYIFIGDLFFGGRR